jgi:hypothetical protein
LVEAEEWHTGCSSVHTVIREHLRTFKHLFLLVDCLIVMASFVVAYYLRKFLPFQFLSEPRALGNYLSLLLLLRVGRIEQTSEVVEGQRPVKGDGLLFLAR